MARGVGERPERSPAAILRRVEYPATREDLVQAAADEEAPAETINFLRSLPDRTYESPEDALRYFAEAEARFGVTGVRLGRGDLGKETTEPPGEPARHP
ncbi:MAG: DUF2795 domain-containing protein [Pseudomonadota bacterium]|nr:MAG: hypothetical protein DIU72_07090 [Pseudomonadota bacterium]